jgi:hypothetical protein
VRAIAAKHIASGGADGDVQFAELRGSGDVASVATLTRAHGGGERCVCVCMCVSANSRIARPIRRTVPGS